MQRAANGVSMSRMQAPWPRNRGRNVRRHPGSRKGRHKAGVPTALPFATVARAAGARRTNVARPHAGTRCTLAWPEALVEIARPHSRSGLDSACRAVSVRVGKCSDSTHGETGIAFIGLPNSGDTFRQREGIRVLVTFDKDADGGQDSAAFRGTGDRIAQGARMVRRRNRRTCGLRIPRGGWRHGCRRGEHPGQRDCWNHRGRD